MTTNNQSNTILDSLGLSPAMTPVVKFPEESRIIREKNEFGKDDYEKFDEDTEEIRKNLQELIDEGMTAVKELASVASQSQDTKAYDALSKMLASVVNSNKELLHLHKTKKVIKIIPEAEKKNDKTDETGQPNVLVLTTSELLDQMLGNSNRAKVIDHEPNTEED